MYPLIEGVMFFKPPRFIPRQKRVSIGVGRGGAGGGATRYVDMVLQVEGGEGDVDTVEFTNINREEVRKGLFATATSEARSISERRSEATS